MQINGYDKGDLPRDGYDPTVQLLPYIDRAGEAGRRAGDAGDAEKRF